jgi:hypothetical protein
MLHALRHLGARQACDARRCATCVCVPVHRKMGGSVSVSFFDAIPRTAPFS